jgi:hypothetical protein
MRDCPVCQSKNKTVAWSMDFVVPDGWELPNHNDICICNDCQMIFYSNDKTQQDYDDYYHYRYDSELTLSSPETHGRLDNLIDFVMDAESRKDARIVDFGGTEGYVEKQLRKFGYLDVTTVNVGDELPKDIDLLIASHVLEHVYDVKSVMDKLTSNLNAGAKFVVDIPDSIQMVRINTLPILDYSQPHINHFTTRTLNALLAKYDYFPTTIHNYVVPIHNYPAFRILYERPDEVRTYYKAKEWCEGNISAKIEKMKNIQGPVVVWGVGDICLLLLKQVPLDVVHFVDINPAFKGQTVMGIPVLDHCESDLPIVVIAQMQREKVIESIRKAGLPNKVYVI